MHRLPGLRLRFNLVVLPIVALGIAVMVWADYRHEYAALMEAHAVHTSVVDSIAPAGPLAFRSLPDAAVRRSLVMHLAYAGALLVILLLALNIVLHVLVLRPVALMRERLASFERGQWRWPQESGADDEVGSLYEDFQSLGLEIDALVGQVLHAERLAMIALLSKRFEQQAGPEVGRIAAIAGRLAQSGAPDARKDSEELGRAAAGILQAVHAYDAVFAPSDVSRTCRARKTALQRVV